MRKWRNAAKAVISAVLVLVLLVGMLPMLSITTEAAGKGLTLDQLMAKFPHGKYWNGGDFYGDTWTETPCTHHGSCNVYDGRCGCNSFMGMSIQCMGFAEKLGYDATTYNPRVNANGWQKYTSVSALNNLKPGDIVRMDSASGFGHSIYVTAVDGETVTYGDCNSRNRSCNIRWGATTTKSYLRSVFQWVQSAPFPLTDGYLSGCDEYVSSGTVEIVSSTTMMSLPCSQEKTEESVEVYTLPAGARVEVVGLYENPDGALWYETVYDGETCYLFSGDTNHFQAVDNTLSISDVRMPENTRKGSSFSLGGTVTSSALEMSEVAAYLYTDQDVTAAPYMTSKATFVRSKTYQIRNSTVDNNMRFGTLPVGSYTYQIQASTVNYFADENELDSEKITKRLHQNTFQVSQSISCTHSFTSEETKIASCGEDGTILNTCAKCGYTYEISTFSEGSHNYEENLVAPTCTQQGYIDHVCTVCGGSYQTDHTDPLGHKPISVIGIPPTCTQEGAEPGQICQVCGETVSGREPIPMLEHQGPSQVVPPTCTQEGYTLVDCQLCGKTCRIDPVEATGHSYVAQITPPTAIEQGYTTHTCTACGHSYVDSYTAPVGQGPAISYEVQVLIGHAESGLLASSIEQSEDEGYLYAVSASDPSELSRETVFTLCVTEDCEEYMRFLLKDAYGRYVYTKADSDLIYVSARLPESGYLWEATHASQEGCVHITNRDTGMLLGYDDQELLFRACLEGDCGDRLFFVVLENAQTGDINDDGVIDNQDVEYLLWYTLFPEEYPLNAAADFNGDGVIDNQDVEYLLWHTLFPEEYPLN